jgi:hypothetical protein
MDIIGYWEYNNKELLLRKYRGGNLYTNLFNIYLELKQWRDDELKQGNIEKARKIQNVIKRKYCLIKLRRRYMV